MLQKGKTKQKVETIKFDIKHTSRSSYLLAIGHGCIPKIFKDLNKKKLMFNNDKLIIETSVV